MSFVLVEHCVRRELIAFSAFKSGNASSIRWASTRPALSEEQPTEFTSAEEPAHVEETNVYASQPHFRSLEGAVSNHTLKAITQNPMKLTHMSPVQAAVLPFLPKLAEPYNPDASEDGAASPQARDILVKARTGTGKTLAFLVPAIEQRRKTLDAVIEEAAQASGRSLDLHSKTRAERTYATQHAGAVILSPTRELATQIANEAMKLTKHHKFDVQLLVGGMSKSAQLRQWSRGRLDIIVATPGRMRDMLENEPMVEKAVASAKMVRSDP